MNNKQALKKVYDEWSDKYDADADHNIAIIKIHPVVLELLKSQSKKDIGLDLGCGTGILTIAASEFSQEITGVDYSEGMLEQARKKQSLGAKLNFIQADLNEALPFSDSSFDYVIAILFVHHVENIEKIYREIFRVLKPGGFFIFDEFTNKPENQAQIDNPFHVNYDDPLSEAKKSGVKVWRIREIEEHKKLLTDVGFNIEKIVDVYCDKKIEPYIIGYKYHEGRVIGKVVLARKKILEKNV